MLHYDKKLMKISNIITCIIEVPVHYELFLIRAWTNASCKPLYQWSWH